MLYCRSSLRVTISWELNHIWGSSQLNPEWLQRGAVLFDKYGPCARTIIDICLAPHKEKAHNNRIKTAAKYVAKNGSTVMDSIKDLDFGSDATLSSLVYIRPESNENRDLIMIFIPTAFLIGELTFVATYLNHLELHKLFSQLTMHPNTRTAAGWLYENFVHARLTTPGEVQAIDNMGKESVIQTTNKFVLGLISILRKASPPLYWRPSQSHFPGIDAVLHTDTETWAIQTTIGNRHGTAEKGLEQILGVLGDKVKRKIRLLIVGPDARRVQSVVRRMKPWNGIPIYSCTLPYEGERAGDVAQMDTDMQV
jgi:hypothetical protein